MVANETRRERTSVVQLYGCLARVGARARAYTGADTLGPHNVLVPTRRRAEMTRPAVLTMLCSMGNAATALRLDMRTAPHVATDTMLSMHGCRARSLSATAKDSASLPKAVVFDLDGCLWYPDMYMLWGGGAPFSIRNDRDLEVPSAVGACTLPHV